MAKGVDVRMNGTGSIRALKSNEVRAELLRRAEAVAAAAGPGFEASVRYGKRRAHASVITATDEARQAQSDDRALERALDAGRA